MDICSLIQGRDKKKTWFVLTKEYFFGFRSKKMPLQLLPKIKISELTIAKFENMID